MSVLIVIPARMKATRLPNKPMANIGGVPMIVQVWRRAMESGVGEVIVACDGEEIAQAVRAAGGVAVMTDPHHPSGSDRVWEAVQKMTIAKNSAAGRNPLPLGEREGPAQREGEGTRKLRTHVPLAQQQQALDRAQSMRRNSTDAEQKMWNILRGRRLDAFKFRRQHPFGHFIADFVCLDQHLVIELDGGQHAMTEQEDAKRTAYFESQGFRVLRFWNNDVLENIEGVAEVIRVNLNTPSPSRFAGPSLSPEGRGHPPTAPSVNISTYDIIINLQGDVPTLEPRLLRELLLPLANPAVDIATLACAITRPEEHENPSVVKAVLSFEMARRSPAGEPQSGRGPGGVSPSVIARALYFTRCPAPYGEGIRYHHIGVYAYRREALERFVALPPSPLELREKLEQLRALEAGMRIDACVVDTVPLGVDTPEDLQRAREIMGDR